MVDIRKAWGKYMCHDCGELGDSEEELQGHDCDEHHKEAQKKHERKFF